MDCLFDGVDITTSDIPVGPFALNAANGLGSQDAAVSEGGGVQSTDVRVGTFGNGSRFVDIGLTSVSPLLIGSMTPDPVFGAYVESLFVPHRATAFDLTLISVDPASGIVVVGVFRRSVLPRITLFNPARPAGATAIRSR